MSPATRPTARAIAEIKEAGELSQHCRWRPVAYLNRIVEQDHRFIKERIAASLWFRSVKDAVNTIAGYESMHVIRKGQVRWLAKATLPSRFDSFTTSLTFPHSLPVRHPIAFWRRHHYLRQIPILVPKVLDDPQLALVYPSGHGDQQEAEWIQDREHVATIIAI